MNFFDKIFGKKTPEAIPDTKPTEILPVDLQFVTSFKEKGGKFLYTDQNDEISHFLINIFNENGWQNSFCLNPLLKNILNHTNIDVQTDANVFFTFCEFLIAEDGSILFSSNQLKEEKLQSYPENFVVLAYTSQFIDNKDKALSAIKFRYQNNIPTNISAVKDYMPQKKDLGFMNYGNNNSKNLYLLLLEDQ